MRGILSKLNIKINYWFVSDLSFRFFTDLSKLGGLEVDDFEKIERPRVFKTHLPIQLLPPQIWTKNAKIVFISRDVKDVAVSNYFIRKIGFRDSPGSMEEHFNEFLKDRVFFAPYREYLKNYKPLEGKKNVLFLTFEGVTSDMDGTVRKVAKFLGKTPTEANIQNLVAHLDFSAMKSK